MADKNKIFNTEKKKEEAVLVALTNTNQNAEKTKEYLAELEFLATTLGIRTRKKFTQRLEKPDVRTFIGKGKLEEINAFIKAEEIKVVIFDDDLSPSQLRNLEKELECKIYDRSLLILDIFSLRAKTAQAKIQVELARLQYLLPRLTKMWTHLERQRGGTGTRGGAGEREIETDRRAIRNQIAVLKEKLSKIEKQSTTRRKSRENIVRVALVGYTNVGKSTIMNAISKSDVFAENKLFATVDSTVRKVVFNGVPFLLTDTVGFIRKLPTLLIESFKSTLDEVREADILIHVVDISHPSYEEQIEVVDSILNDIGCANTRKLIVFNKIDAYEKNPELEQEESNDVESLEAGLKNRYQQEVVLISAMEKQHITKLKNIIHEVVLEVHLTIYPNYLKNLYE